MEITISFFMLVTIVLISLIGGFWIGRSVRWMMVETEGRIEEGAGELKRIPLGYVLGSPATGIVRGISSSNGRGALIYPEEGKLYAPASGKITRLYPMGNTMLLRTDFGVELMLCVGDRNEEMHSIYYRSYVVQNEIVSKGKLLLEYDMEGLSAVGVDAAISVTVEETAENCEITLTRKEHVKTGEELLWVSCGIHRE